MNIGVTKKIGCMLALCFFVPALAAPTMQELFLRANHLYEQGQVQEALTTYQEIHPAGSATWYNMGLCFARLGSTSRALACWRQAEHTASLAELRMIAQAIEAVGRTQGLAQSHGTISRVLRTMRLYAHALPPVLIQLLVLLGLFLLFFCAKWWYYGLHGKSVILGVSCVTLLGVGSMYLQYQDQIGRHGVIVVAKAPIYSGPDSQFHQQGELPNATEVAIQETAGSWYKVAHADLTGWVAADAMVVV